MELEERLQQIERAIGEQHNTVVRLMNAELALRALALAIIRQPALDPCRLLEDCDAFLLSVLDQVPPHLQRTSQLDEIIEPLRSTCRDQRSRGTKHAS